MRHRKHIVTFFYLVLFLISILPFIAGFIKDKNHNAAGNELFTEDLSRLNSIPKLLNFTDSLYQTKHATVLDTGKYTTMLSQVVKERFYHGELNYSLSENWIAWICGKLFWSHLSSIVIPSDILKHQKGLCSQQTIVLMKALREKKINVRSVGLGYKQGPGHFLCEVMYEGKWHLHDVSVEPLWTKLNDNHESLDFYLLKKDSLFLAYESRLPQEIFYKIMEKSHYGEINQMPAFNMRLFHTVTKIITYIFPCLFLFLAIRKYSRN